MYAAIYSAHVLTAIDADVTNGARTGEPPSGLMRETSRAEFEMKREVFPELTEK
jgi:hypothetical protein